MKKTLYCLLSLPLLLCLAMPLQGAKAKGKSLQSGFAGYIRYAEFTAGLEITADNAVVPLLSNVQRSHLDTPHNDRVISLENKEQRLLLKSTGSVPQSVVIGCHCDMQTDHQHRFEIAENADFKDSVTFTVTSPVILIGNLKIATKYHWRVTCEVTDTSEKAVENHTFTTSDIAPRLMAIDGVGNVRDLGGWKTIDGKRVRQNRIFRSSEMNGKTKRIYKTEDAILAENLDLKDLAEKHKSAMRLAKGAMDEQVAFISAKSLSINNDRLEWTLFRAPVGKCDGTDIENFVKMSEIPTEYCGLKAEKLAAEGKKRTFVIPDGESYETALLMVKIHATEDGVVQITGETDVSCVISINGNVLWNTLDVQAPPSLTFGLPVRQGDNRVAVILRQRGKAKGFSIKIPRKTFDQKRLCENRIKFEKDILKKMFNKVLDHVEPGKGNLKPGMQKYLTEGLKIRTDLDLRPTDSCLDMTASPLGESVKWLHIPAPAYEDIATPEGKKAMAAIFRALLNADAYPVILHGSAGQDRTGTVAFLLNGILGVPLEQLLLDWEASAFHSAKMDFIHKKALDKLRDALRAYDGQNIHENIEKYFLNCGITPAEIKSFQNLMKE